MFKKLLIANRGEIAVRIIRAARELRINTVAVYSETDKNSSYTILADRAIYIGPTCLTDSYLDMNVVLSVAIVTGVQATRPDFGSLSESSRFATMCEEMHTKFVGSSAEIMDKMGDKTSVHAEMTAVNVPAILGSDGEVFTAEEALEVTDRLGYPIMLKASTGGGGKGVRKVESAEELVSAFESTSQEVLAAFGNGAAYVEEVIYPARYIEVQILDGSHGNVAHLDERGYSPQHNDQKVLEESPSVVTGETLRVQIGDAAIRIAETVHYENASTIEFLLDEKTSKFYFIEASIRVRIEHPVTESVTSVDIAGKQIRIAAGQSSSVTQGDITITGHAIGYRINAENPEFNFASSLGKITDLYLPSGGVGLRVGSVVYNGYSISSYYDSMTAKIIVHGENRFDALMKMQRAFYELEIEGVTINAEFRMSLISGEHVIAGGYGTSFLMEAFLSNYNKEDD